jgi:hypothetical protein
LCHVLCLQAIDEQIAELEFKLTHESLSAAQEKAMREKKERMQRQDRPAVERLSQVSARIDECKAASDALRAEILVLNGRLDSIKAARDKEEAMLSELRAAEQEARSDIPGLHVEKKELWEVIQALRDKQREIRDAFQKQWDEFKKLDRAWKGWNAQERRKRCAAAACGNSSICSHVTFTAALYCHILHRCMHADKRSCRFTQIKARRGGATAVPVATSISCRAAEQIENVLLHSWTGCVSVVVCRCRLVVPADRSSASRSMRSARLPARHARLSTSQPSLNRR